MGHYDRAGKNKGQRAQEQDARSQGLQNVAVGLSRRGWVLLSSWMKEVQCKPNLMISKPESRTKGFLLLYSTSLQNLGSRFSFQQLGLVNLRDTSQSVRERERWPNTCVSSGMWGSELERPQGVPGPMQNLDLRQQEKNAVHRPAASLAQAAGSIWSMLTSVSRDCFPSSR